MTDATIPEIEEPQKGSKLPLILGFILMLLGGGGGYFAVSSGLVLGNDSAPPEEEKVPDVQTANDENITFVSIDPFSVSLSPDSSYKHLRFRAELEVNAQYLSEVETVMPRLVNVMNGYLRAVEASDLAEPASLTRLRAQLLRRTQIVAGPGRINDLLIMEFVLN